jgi:thioester reductase-like protein
VGDCIIDTNVLLVASAQHPGSPFEDSDVPERHMQIVLDWLMAFHRNSQCSIVLDHLWKIWEEYHHKMTGQDIGLMVMTEKLQSASARFVDVEYDKNNHGRLPRDLENVIHDRSDRKFVATALSDLMNGSQSTIINAIDSDWCDWEKALERAGITVKHLIEDLCDDKRQSGTKRPPGAKSRRKTKR